MSSWVPAPHPAAASCWIHQKKEEWGLPLAADCVLCPLSQASSLTVASELLQVTLAEWDSSSILTVCTLHTHGMHPVYPVVCTLYTHGVYPTYILTVCTLYTHGLHHLYPQCATHIPMASLHVPHIPTACTQCTHSTCISSMPRLHARWCLR